MSEVKANQIISIYDRGRLTVSCVQSVLAFDDEYLKLNSALGLITIEGKGLLIENLSKEKGEILVTGTINKVEFYEQKKKR